jgi:hypothetical protein
MARRDDSAPRPVAGHVVSVVRTVKVWPRALTSAHVVGAPTGSGCPTTSCDAQSVDSVLLRPR